MGYQKKLAFGAGTRVRFADCDPASKGSEGSAETAAEAIQAYRPKLTEQQKLLYAKRGRSLLVILEVLPAHQQGEQLARFAQQLDDSICNPEMARRFKERPSRNSHVEARENAIDTTSIDTGVLVPHPYQYFANSRGGNGRRAHGPSETISRSRPKSGKNFVRRRDDRDTRPGFARNPNGKQA